MATWKYFPLKYFVWLQQNDTMIPRAPPSILDSKKCIIRMVYNKCTGCTRRRCNLEGFYEWDFEFSHRESRLYSGWVWSAFFMGGSKSSVYDNGFRTMGFCYWNLTWMCNMYGKIWCKLCAYGNIERVWNEIYGFDWGSKYEMWVIKLLK